LGKVLKVNVYKDLDLCRYAKILRENVKLKNLILMLARCSVEYEGRGASYLGEGDRLIIIKKDLAFLVHRPTGYSPVNWQPESSFINIECKDDMLIIKAVRARPREIVTVKVSNVYSLLVASGLEDAAEFIEYIDEHEMREVLIKNPDLIEPGLKVISIEKPVEPGFIDMYCTDSKGNIVVIELKRVTASKEAVQQLARYVNAVKASMGIKNVRGILVAPSITKSALQLLNLHGMEFKQINLSKIRSMLKEMKEAKKIRERTLLSYFMGGKTGN